MKVKNQKFSKYFIHNTTLLAITYKEYFFISNCTCTSPKSRVIDQVIFNYFLKFQGLFNLIRINIFNLKKNDSK